MSVNVLEPCEPWVTVEDLCCTVAEGDEARAERVCTAATEVLHALSGRRFGVCSTVETLNTAEVCGPPSAGGDPRFPGYSEAAASSRSLLALAVTPVQYVTSVVEDGVLLTEVDDYRVDDWRVLVREGSPWIGEVVVTYGGGPAVPTAGTLAAAELACELLKACTGDATCALPSGVQNIARQGVTYNLFNPLDFLDSGRIGLRLCDLFLSAVNPAGLTSRSRIVNPDDVVARHRSTPVTPPAP